MFKKSPGLGTFCTQSVNEGLISIYFTITPQRIPVTGKLSSSNGKFKISFFLYI
jgi:hypothetical protein